MAINIFGRLGRRGVAVLIAVAIAIPVIAITTISTPPAGVYIELKLFRDVGGGIKSLSIGRDIGVAISVLAISPPNYNGSDFIPIYAGKYTGDPIYIPAKGKLLDIARAWEEEHRVHGARMDTFEHGLIIFMHILNLTAIKNKEYDKVEIARYVDSIPIKPIDIVSGKAIRYTVSLAVGSEKIARLTSIDRKYLSIELNIPGIRKIYAATPVELPSSEEDRWCINAIEDSTVGICYRRKYYIGSENLTTILPQEYVSPCISDNSKMCMKTPIMMIYNQYNYSGTIEIAIGISAIFRSSVYLTWSLGDLTAGLINNKIYLAGRTISDNFCFIEGFSVPPESKRWIWILARPIFAEYETYYAYGGANIGEFLVGYLDKYLNECSVGSCCDSGCFLYRANNTITATITYISYNVVNNIKYIVGGREYGEPKQIVDMMFNGTEEQYVKRLNTSQSLLFDDIFNTYDAIDFEIGVPVGAVAAVFLEYSGLITNSSVLSFIAGFSVDIAREGLETFSGSLYNAGDDPAIPNDYNVWEDVYIRVSKYEYIKNGYRFKVPIGIYYTLRTV
ncbi:hypothetical protein Igag_0997 [Ignisphaera aggregans DSM 17230]|uniref:Uncharacterized protein n=1 Tax=Ignisphaera aggregans (strain DSM 17230 / JCM 13409 / AQ1.S1) TaxID=583356 RepID=E0SNL6_IGNAA|nr:hypothetical protein Igag_0997 [Ignisphaera aggregans DSM 17230]